MRHGVWHKSYLVVYHEDDKVQLMATKKNRQRARQHLDEQLVPLRESNAVTMPPRGWIRAYRDALGMTAAQLGSRMGISQVAVTQLEQREREGTISVESLRRAARAMDATAHCVFVPNSTLEDTVLRRAREVANRDLEGVDHSMRLEDQAVEQRATERLLREHIADVLDSRRLWAKDR